MKKALIIIAVFLFAVFVPIFAEASKSMPSDSVIQSSANTLGIPFNDLKDFVSKYYVSLDIDKPDLIFNCSDSIAPIDEFCKECIKNRVAFLKKYENKCIEIQAIRVSEVGGWDNIFKGFECDFGYYDINSWMSYSIKAFFKRSEEDKFINLSEGSIITIRGFIKDDTYKPYLYDAVIVQY